MKLLPAMLCMWTCALLTGCNHSQSKLIGSWVNAGTQGEGLSYAFPPNWNSIEFRSDGQVHVAWAGKNADLFTYQVVDEEWFKFGGYAFQYHLRGDELTVKHPEVGDATFRRE